MHLNVLWEVAKILEKDPKIKEEIDSLKRIAISTFIWLVATELVLVIQPYPIKWFFDGLLTNGDRYSLWFLCLFILVMHIAGTMLHTEMERRRNGFFWKMWAVLWGYGHFKQLSLSTDWHVAHSTGEKESVLSKNVAKVETLIDDLIFDTIPMTLRVIFTSLGIWWLGWYFGLLSSATLLTYALIMIVNEKVFTPLRKAFREQVKKIERDGSELVQNWRSLKQFGLEKDQCDEHINLLQKHCLEEKIRFKKFIYRISYQEHVVSFSRALLYSVILYFFSSGESIGSIILATAWMERIYSNLYRFSGFQRHLNEGLESMRELKEMFETVPTVRQPDKPIWKENVRGKIILENVSFSYPHNEECSLKNLNLTVKENSCTALVGYSGSGKSTIASLLLREYDPTEGRILVDGMDLREIDYDRYRREIVSVVSQDVELFDTTILENIRIVKRGASEEEVKKAAERAYASEFIDKLKDGYNTLIGEDGIRLSGGQRQRLAIARALLRKPQILILDEATSSLDALSQSYIQKTIDELIKSREITIVVIAHRFSTIKQADLVIVMEDGEITETGTHKELAAKGNTYKILKSLEAEGLSETVHLSQRKRP